MAFTKAAPQQAKLKVSVYGPPGSGKTFSTLLMAEGLAKREGKRVAFVDTERGTDFYALAVPGRAVHPETFDFDAVYTKSLSKVVSECRALDPKTHGVIVIDSISHLWDAAQEAYEGKRGGKDGDKIPFGAWSKIKKPYKDLLRFLIESPFHVFILGRQKSVFDEKPDGSVTKIGVAMRAEGETQYEPHICIRMEAAKDPTKPNSSLYYGHVEKDRSGVLAGKMLLNPSFNSIEPLLSILGGEQAKEEDEDERIAADGDLLDDSDAKALAKAEKSSGLFATLHAALTTASDPTAVGAFVVQMTKQKRYLTEEHLAALRGLYEVKRAQVANQFMGEVKTNKE